jgi:ubiquinone/menaquinone biosynthesis C-methylase UbiE
MRSNSPAKVVPLDNPILPWATERRLLFDPPPTEFEQRAEETGWTSTLQRLKNLTLRHLPRVDGLRVLDVACGPGILAREFSHAGARITGLDASLEMLEHAAKHLGRGDALHQYDLAWPLDSCRLTPREFDLVICSGALQLCPDYRERLRDFAAMLAPQGVLAAAFPCEYSAGFEPSCRRIQTPELLSVLRNCDMTVQEHEKVRGYTRTSQKPVPYSLLVATAPTQGRRSPGYAVGYEDLKVPPRISPGIRE